REPRGRRSAASLPVQRLAPERRVDALERITKALRGVACDANNIRDPYGSLWRRPAGTSLLVQRAFDFRSCEVSRSAHVCRVLAVGGRDGGRVRDCLLSMVLARFPGSTHKSPFRRSLPGAIQEGCECAHFQADYIGERSRFP